MTFEQKFILNCLNSMEQILSREEELNKAIQQFTEEKSTLSRYQHNSKITDATHWNDGDKLRLNAAVFEAIARASLEFFSEKDGRALEINRANKVFLEKYLPSITEKTNPHCRLHTVQENIVRIKEEEFKSIRVDKRPNFFTPVITGGITLIAAAATIALFSRDR